jgi:RNA polymerase sigma factor (sigma-70 family)
MGEFQFPILPNSQIPQSLNEKKLISDCRNGVKQSQYLLVKRYAGMLLSVCRRYTRDESMAKDILQETFIRIFENIGKYEPTGSFEAWMRRIAVRRSLQWLDKSCFRQESQPDEMPDEEVTEPEVYRNMGAEEIMALVLELPPGYRAVFNLFAVEGYDHREIGELLGISESTSRSQLARARKLLQDKLFHLKNRSRYEVADVRK